MNQDKIGSFIKKIRSEKQMTQLELAEKIGVTDRAISKWERGKGLPDISLLIPLSNELGITVLELLTGEKIIDENKAVVNIIKNHNKKIKLWKYLFLTIINIILIITSIIIFTGYIIPNKYQNNKNQGILKIISSSMLPTFEVGDTIVYDKVSINNIKENDLVIYYYKDSNNTINNIKTIHRVNKIIYDNTGNINLITKGDNNLELDNNYVTKDNFIGIYNHKLPYLLNTFIKENKTISPMLLTFLIVVILSIIYLDILEIIKNR